MNKIRVLADNESLKLFIGAGVDFAVTRSLLANSRDVVKRFVQALSGAIALARRERAEADRVYARYLNVKDPALLEFMYTIPREQLIRPGQRRSLMRRALVGIVPDEVLNRKRKAYVARAPLAAISSDWARLAETTQHMVSGTHGIFDTKRITEAVQMARQGTDVPVLTLIRTLCTEDWLKHLCSRGILASGGENICARPKELVPTFISADKH